MDLHVSSLIILDMIIYVFDENLNYLKGPKNSKIKLKNKLERVLLYFDWIEGMDTSTSIFKII
jgi:hypothetical protein